jgi:hypothetical protein
MSARRRSFVRLAFGGALAATLSLVPAVRAQQASYASNEAPELDSATQAALRIELARARARGLPIEPLLAKVREGQIKRAQPGRIRAAVASLATRLDSARAALGPSTTPEEMISGADAIAAGADAKALRTLRVEADRRDLVAPLGALAQLVASGVAPRRATRLIVELLHRDAPATQLLAFGNAVEADVVAGVPAEESALFRLRAIESGTSAPSAGAALGQSGDLGGQNPSGRPGTSGGGPVQRRP